MKGKTPSSGTPIRSNVSSPGKTNRISAISTIGITSTSPRLTGSWRNWCSTRTAVASECDGRGRSGDQLGRCLAVRGGGLSAPARFPRPPRPGAGRRC